jgi:hypothetical protein
MSHSFSHESRLLREPWPSRAKLPSGKHIFARPCLFGDSCVGMSPNLPGHFDSGGVVLAESMSPAELEEFNRTGKNPPVRRCCVLCSRYVITDAYLYINKQSTRPANVYLNEFTNPVGCPDGYARDRCIPFEGSNTHWSGIFGNVAMLCFGSLRLVQVCEWGLRPQTPAPAASSESHSSLLLPDTSWVPTYLCAKRSSFARREARGFGGGAPKLESVKSSLSLSLFLNLP